MIYSKTTRIHVPAGTEFTASNGLGSATASTLTLSVPASTAATSATNVPRLTIPHNCDPFNIEVIAKLASVSGGDGNTWYRMWICDSSLNTWIFAQANGVAGTTSLYGTSGFLASGGTLALDGTGWMRIVVRDGRVSWYFGTGSAGSQDWALKWRGEPTFPTSPGSSNYSLIRLDMYQGGGAAGTVTSQWSDVQIMSIK